ncbi:Tn3 family transposase [Streptomyces lydicus]
MENWNSANTVLHYGKEGALTGPDKEHAETSMLALHLLRSALVHVNTLLVQQVLAEPKWAMKLSEEYRRGLTALFWSKCQPVRHLPPGHEQAPRPRAGRCRALPPHTGGRRGPRAYGEAMTASKGQQVRGWRRLRSGRHLSADWLAASLSLPGTAAPPAPCG